jgi:hypothetical protein
MDRVPMDDAAVTNVVAFRQGPFGLSFAEQPASRKKTPSGFIAHHLSDTVPPCGPSGTAAV